MDTNIYRIESTDLDGKTGWVKDVTDIYVSHSPTGNIWHNKKSAEKAVIKFTKRNKDYKFELVPAEIVDKRIKVTDIEKYPLVDGIRYACYADIENDEDPHDNCVLDEDPNDFSGCIHAKDSGCREQCELWKPLGGE